MQQLAYSVEQFLEKVPIGRTKLYQEIAAKRIHVVKVGRRTLIPADAAAKYVQRLVDESNWHAQDGDAA
ncbi:MAG: hypothetical protein JJT85_11110 [Chromatiales bacterium]|nr:hypothetical protein [Chromatiales bacterium]